MSDGKRNDSLLTAVAISGAVVGGLVGAIAGILLAPASGKDTREQLRKKGGKLYTEGKKEWGKFQEKTLDPNVKKFKKEFGEKFDETKEKLMDRLDTTEKKSTKKK